MTYIIPDEDATDFEADCQAQQMAWLILTLQLAGPEDCYTPSLLMEVGLN